MPELTKIHTRGLLPIIHAFDGHPSKTRDKNLLDGEKHNDEFLQLIHNGKDNGFPPQFHKHLLVSDAEVQQRKIDKGNPYPLKCFLWIIDVISVKILWEMTPNLSRKKSIPEKPYVCHTNITGDGEAYIGGEMYFCENGITYINFNSDRYGVVASEQKKLMAIKYMEDCDYKNITRTDNNL
ncbi:MAG TPA: hypothetical protein VIJ27_02875 [Mucilaginibacter sp.]